MICKYRSDHVSFDASIMFVVPLYHHTCHDYWLRQWGLGFWQLWLSGMWAHHNALPVPRAAHVERLFRHKPFWNQFCALRVDNIHLLYHQGWSFQVTLLQIKHIWACCPTSVITCALSATVAKGQVVDNVCKFLRFKEGQFHLIQHLNDWPEVQLLIHKLQTALGGWLFPQLDWIIDEDQKTLIFTPTINLEFCIKTYLWRLAIHCRRDPRKFIHMYNWLNCPNYNTKTLDIMHHDPEFKILLLMDCLCVGFNCKHI